MRIRMEDSRLATAKASSRRNNGNRLLWLGGVTVALLALWAAFGSAALGYARAGSAYGARVACSCRFVAGRSLDDCAKDKVPGMELVSLSEDAEAKSVTARMLILASDTATYREGYGCVLDRWDD
ncbi:hypothetical protein [Tsuneonella deserti]|uniref:hypothetical protein n=1 Tax=Tsuneonella deserti TaxID=2035528 RepID=UPI001E40CB71|nr:hypothetical protein [Tsuneonella deserti]